MKKNYLFIIILCCSLFMKAQTTDLRVEFDDYSEGQIVSGTGSIFGGGINGDFTITNDGNNTLAIGDTILIAYLKENVLTAVNLSLFGPTNFNSITLTAPLLPGESLTFSNSNTPGSLVVATLNMNSESEICAIAYKQNPSDNGGGVDTAFTNDINPANNKSCVLYKPIISGIDENSLSSKSIYMLNNKLVINTEFTSNNSNSVLTITNLTGQTVKRKNLWFNKGINNSIDLSNLPKGIYIASLQIVTEVIAKKISIE